MGDISDKIAPFQSDKPPSKSVWNPESEMAEGKQSGLKAEMFY